MILKQLRLDIDPYKVEQLIVIERAPQTKLVTCHNIRDQFVIWYFEPTEIEADAVLVEIPILILKEGASEPKRKNSGSHSLLGMIEGAYGWFDAVVIVERRHKYLWL